MVQRSVSDQQLDAWADRITAALNKTVDAIFETGRLLAEAKAAIKHGEWTRLCEEKRIPLSQRSADCFIAIWTARERLMPNSQHVASLPSSWSTLYDLQALPEDTLAWAIDEGRIRPDMQRKDVAALKREFGGTGAHMDDTPMSVRLHLCLSREFKKCPREQWGEFVEKLRAFAAYVDSGIRSAGNE